MRVKIILATTPPGKVADAELVFDSTDGVLSGLRLIGFGVWERPRSKDLNVTFPARQYSVNGERRSFALLRPTDVEYGVTAQNRVRDLIVEAYRGTEGAEQTTTVDSVSKRFDTEVRPALDGPLKPGF